MNFVILVTDDGDPAESGTVTVEVDVSPAGGADPPPDDAGDDLTDKEPGGCGCATGGNVPAGWLFAAGTVIFSGSLYVMSLPGMRWLGAVTPLGGLCFLAGWAWLAWGVWRGA